MLFLTRKESERIVIMNEIEVQILKIEDDCIRIGITAPPDVSVQRFEVFKKIQAANRAAARSKKPVKDLGGLIKSDNQKD